jgi:uncharacterized alpha-E superfamily protein
MDDNPRLEVLETLRKSARALRVRGRPEIWEEAARYERRLLEEIEAAKQEKPEPAAHG